MPLHNLTRFPRLEFIGAPTPLEYLPRFSDYLGREIFIKRDDVTPMAMAAINYVSWNFSRQMPCAKVPIR
ncbi:D-cysteine desulfhydrase [Escherichia coli]|uniref:D-cysteine desulfhydrase n=1 Tax=Escherichia coli TaxID=562 RepID=A0A376U916_ECOLX|nr:D-cysteine desulfhydrase [Escherichia coli]